MIPGRQSQTAPVRGTLSVMLLGQCKHKTTVQKMNRTKISDKPYLPSFAKAKEKQRHTQANSPLLHICFCPTAQRPSPNLTELQST